MKRIIALVTLALTPTLLAQTHERHGGSSMWTDDTDLTSCSEVHVRYDGHDAVRSEQELPVANVRSLRIVSESHAAIRVTGWDQPRYAATVCKAAELPETLGKIDVRLSGDEITASGPDGERWNVYVLVRTPRRASLAIETKNGPVSLRRVDGTISVRAKNGPIALLDPSGSVDVTTVNGPIALNGGSGEIKLSATNGPLALKLGGQRWEGHLTASTKNGPVTLKLPHGFSSGVEALVEGRGPIACKAEACGASRATYRGDDDERPRRITFGSGERTVNVSTHNGPLVVNESD